MESSLTFQKLIRTSKTYMKKIIGYSVLFLFLQTIVTAQQKALGNPVIEGWYADPEGVIINQQYWIFPTFSAKYKDQVFLDAFSSKDLVNWVKHPRVIDTSIIKWAYMAMWAPSIVKKDNRYYLFFSANDIQSKKKKRCKR